MSDPPFTLAIQFCPECGRYGRVVPFPKTAHWWRGAPCVGTPVTVVYEFKHVLPKACLLGEPETIR